MEPLSTVHGWARRKRLHRRGEARQIAVMAKVDRKDVFKDPPKDAPVQEIQEARGGPKKKTGGVMAAEVALEMGTFVLFAAVIPAAGYYAWLLPLQNVEQAMRQRTPGHFRRAAAEGRVPRQPGRGAAPPHPSKVGPADNGAYAQLSNPFDVSRALRLKNGGRPFYTPTQSWPPAPPGPCRSASRAQHPAGHAGSPPWKPGCRLAA